MAENNQNLGAKSLKVPRPLHKKIKSESARLEISMEDTIERAWETYERVVANITNPSEVLDSIDGSPVTGVISKTLEQHLGKITVLLQELPEAVVSKLQDQGQERSHGAPAQAEQITPELQELRQAELAIRGRNAYTGIARALDGLPEDKLRLVEALAWKLSRLDLSKKDTINKPLTDKLRSIADEYDKEAARKRDEHQPPKTGTHNR